MNAAEITDKLGLHSLRQRAWVSRPSTTAQQRNANPSTVHPVYLRYLRRRSVRGSRVARHYPPQGGTPVDGYLEASAGSQHLPSAPCHVLSPSPAEVAVSVSVFGCNLQSYREWQSKLVHKPCRIFLNLILPLYRGARAHTTTLPFLLSKVVLPISCEFTRFRQSLRKRSNTETRGLDGRRLGKSGNTQKGYVQRAVD